MGRDQCLLAGMCPDPVIHMCMSKQWVMLCLSIVFFCIMVSFEEATHAMESACVAATLSYAYTLCRRYIHVA